MCQFFDHPTRSVVKSASEQLVSHTDALESEAALESRTYLSRRSVLRRTSVLGALFAGAASASPPREVGVDIDPNALLTKLVRRTSQGLTQAEVQRAATLGYKDYLEYQLNPSAIDDSAVEARVQSLPTMSMTVQQIVGLNQGQVINELTEATILRSVFSQRGLLQRMVEFWTDHFNIDITKTACFPLKTADDRDVIRAHALDTFPALLSASAHSAAMLGYLDNQTSTAAHPNENYAREIMELHTLGVDGGYTQSDVIEVAKCFSGWSYVDPVISNPNSGNFLFFSANHTPGPKIVLGHTITSGGINDGLAVLDILSNHPSTARFIAKKLCKWLLGESTPQSVINSVASTYSSTNGDIKAMIRTALTPAYLADALPRYKRPYHAFISALRALPTTITVASVFRSHLDGAGHRPFYWPTPDGYPDNPDFWIGFVVPRWNFGAQLMYNDIFGLRVDTVAFAGGQTNADVLISKIDQALFGGEMPPTDRARVLQYMLPNPVPDDRLREAIGLAIGSPGFQWY